LVRKELIQFEMFSSKLPYFQGSFSFFIEKKYGIF
jgi:hypothetical protein